MLVHTALKRLYRRIVYFPVGIRGKIPLFPPHRQLYGAEGYDRPLKLLRILRLNLKISSCKAAHGIYKFVLTCLCRVRDAEIAVVDQPRDMTVSQMFPVADGKRLLTLRAVFYEKVSDGLLTEIEDQTPAA